MHGKAVQEETDFHADMRSEGGGKALTCPGEHQSMRWPQAWLHSILGGAEIVAKYCCGVTYSAPQCL